MADRRYTETFLFDEITHTDPIAAGAEFRYFVDTSSKNRRQQNFDNERRIQSGAEMLIWSLRIQYAPDVPLADALLIEDQAWVQLLVDDIPQMEGTISLFPWGGGLVAWTPEAAATGDTVSNGLQSAQAAYNRRTPVKLDGDQTYEVIIRYGAAADLSASAVITVALLVQLGVPVRA